MLGRYQGQVPDDTFGCVVAPTPVHWAANLWDWDAIRVGSRYRVVLRQRKLLRLCEKLPWKTDSRLTVCVTGPDELWQRSHAVEAERDSPRPEGYFFFKGSSLRYGQADGKLPGEARLGVQEVQADFYLPCCTSPSCRKINTVQHLSWYKHLLENLYVTKGALWFTTIASAANKHRHK